MDNRKTLSLYIHIPFCLKKCNYCDFLSFPCECTHTANTVDINNYIDALCREIDYAAIKYSQYEIYSIFIGGGTPSLLTEQQISRIFDSLYRFQFLYPEITIEANPGTISQEKARCWKKLGINRISIGLQSADNDELAMLGRIHTWETFLESWEIISKAGFTNRNIDLISGLPGQTVERYKDTLEKVVALKPEHISAYSLQLEEGTVFYDRYTPEDLPSEDEDRQMYELTRLLLKEAGYNRYEISNYSRPGYESKHNLVYWQRDNYLGLGLGAASMVENVRFSNVTELDEYCELTWANIEDNSKPEENLNKKNHPLADNQYSEENKKPFDMEKRLEYQPLSTKEQMEEYMFLGLRVMKGVSEADFYRQFGSKLKSVYGQVLDRYIASGHMKYIDGYYLLTERGIDVSNVILADFLMDE